VAHALFHGGRGRIYPGLDPVFHGALGGVPAKGCCCDATFCGKVYIYQLDNK
jgi:hypothetical protein